MSERDSAIATKQQEKSLRTKFEGKKQLSRSTLDGTNPRFFFLTTAKLFERHYLARYLREILDHDTSGGVRRERSSVIGVETWKISGRLHGGRRRKGVGGKKIRRNARTISR